MSNPESLLPEVIASTRKVCDFIKSNFGLVKNKDIITKDHNSLVSYVDQKAESLFVKDLQAILPIAGFITEEDTANQEKEYTWVIDPLDGTTNFLYNIPHCSTSVALKKGNELILGVIGDVMTGHVYSAAKNYGAFKDDTKISVDRSSSISEAVIATGFPYDADYDKEPYFKMMEYIMSNARGLRRFGSAALDLAYVAEGRFQAYYETSLNPWDVAAGIVIVQEAQGICTSFFPDKLNFQSGNSIIAGNDKIVSELQLLTNQYFDASQY